MLWRGVNNLSHRHSQCKARELFLSSACTPLGIVKWLIISLVGLFVRKKTSHAMLMEIKESMGLLE